MIRTVRVEIIWAEGIRIIRAEVIKVIRHIRLIRFIGPLRMIRVTLVITPLLRVIKVTYLLLLPQFRSLQAIVIIIKLNNPINTIT